LDIAGVVVGNRRALNYSDKHVERRAAFTNAGELAALNPFAEQALQCAPGNVRQCIANGIDTCTLRESRHRLTRCLSVRYRLHFRVLALGL